MKFVISYILFVVLWVIACLYVNYDDDLHKTDILVVGGVIILIWSSVNDYINKK